ncbi:MAG: response regulator [Pirellulales bacterium]
MSLAPTLSEAPVDSKQQTALPKVLCIDDDPEISRIIQLRLSEFEVEVERAFCGMQGHWLAVTSNPDVIITDLRMPQGEGEYILECLKRNAETFHIPVIVLTGKSGNDLSGQLKSLGAAGFLRKPFHFDELFNELSQYIKLRSRDFD